METELFGYLYLGITAYSTVFLKAPKEHKSYIA